MGWAASPSQPRLAGLAERPAVLAGGRTPAGLRAGVEPGRGAVVQPQAVELANLTLPILAAVIDQAHRGIDRVRRTRTWPTRSCGTPACRSRDRGQPLPNSSAMVEESSPPRCDPRCMRHQPPQRRYWRWFCLLVVLGMLIAVPLVLAAHHRQQGVEGQCAVHVAGDKPELAGYHWSWWWLPGWVCEFERDGRRWERRLW